MLWSRTGKVKAARGNADEDVRLVKRLMQRDERAFLEVYDRYRRAVYRFLIHMTGSIAASEELTQEVFIVLLDAMCSGTIGQFDSEKGTLEGYLLGIARNLARQERRRTHRLVSLDDVLETPEWNRLFEPFDQDNRTWDAAAILATRAELRHLYRAILELPGHYREAVILCSLQQKSYQEAAAILQCSEGTIASRMNRAKALLGAKLRRSAPDEVNTTAI